MASAAEQAVVPADITPPMTPERAAKIGSDFDLRRLPPDFLANPYPVLYAWLRLHDPVRAMPDGAWFLTRHADLVAVYRDAATFSSDKHIEFAPKYGTESPLYEHHTTSLVFNDPPLHTRVRKLILGALEPVLSAERRAAGETAVREMLDYLRRLVAHRRCHPLDPQRDVLTRLIQGEQDGERLTETELLHNGIFLLNAGHETTTNLIGNALVCLHEWPQQKAWLQQRLRAARARFRGFLRAPFRV